MRLVSSPLLLVVCAALCGCNRGPLELVASAETTAPARARAAADRADYLEAGLRREVETLIAAIEAEPTTAASCGERARVLWRWANGWALTGRQVSEQAVSMLAGVAASEARGEPCGPRILAEMDDEIRELAMRDREPDAFGSLRFTPPREPLRAASWATIEQTFTVGTRPVRPGGGFLLGNQIMADQSSIQNRDPAGDAYVTARSSNAAVVLEPTVKPLAGRHGGFKGTKDMPVFRVAQGALAPGDTVTFTYGERSGGSKGLRLQTVSTDNLLLPIYVDVDGKGRFVATEWPALVVSGMTEAVAAAVFAPSVVRTGERFDVVVRTEDRYGNRSAVGSPRYELTLDGAVVARLARGDAGIAVAKGLRLSKAGTYRFAARSDDGKLAAISNPVWVEARPDRRVYWGELHGHSGYAEGQGAADQYFRYARDDARLDFVSLTDHDTAMDDWEWRAIDESRRRYAKEGEFVAFLGYEWSAGREIGGHHNVFFRNDEAKRVPRQEAPVLDALYPRLARENGEDNVLVIPHAHTAADWNQSDADVERLVEIDSMHGTFEWFGNKYLQNGYEIGFIAASDDHRSKPGRAPGLFFSPQVQPGGLAAAIAPEKARDAIFDALRGRSAYATSGDRILLDARLNGERMGTRQRSSDRRTIEGRVSGTAPIDRIDVIKNGEVAWSQSYLAAPLASHAWVEVAFESSSEVFTTTTDNPREYRVWSGTLDVEGAKVVGLKTTGLENAYLEWARIDPERPNRIRFYTETRGKAETILVELEGASAATRFVFDLIAAKESGFGQGVRPLAQIPAVNVSLSLADLDDSRLEHELPVDRHVDRLRLQVVDAGGSLDRDFAFTDLGEPRDGDYYYVRVTQLDGAQAWSSPFWVGPAGRPPVGRPRG
ncbi:MAG TPA: DUF3604 domain-containing protein [Thermoanaerobaculia bacterium]|nr:DUF3604 domain-containing protein [Thermoanaerobaculia bacterium]